MATTFTPGANRLRKSNDKPDTLFLPDERTAIRLASKALHPHYVSQVDLFNSLDPIQESTHKSQPSL